MHPRITSTFGSKRPRTKQNISSLSSLSLQVGFSLPKAGASHRRAAIVSDLVESELLVLNPFPIPDPTPTPTEGQSDPSNVTYTDCIVKIYINSAYSEANFNISILLGRNCNLIGKDRPDDIDREKKRIEELIILYAANLVKEMNDTERLKHQLLFLSRLSINYHTRAERVFIAVANIATYLALVLSAGALAALSDIFSPSVDLKPVGGGFSIIVLIINGAVLAYGIPQKANTHASFRAQWHKLMGAIVRIEPTDENYSKLKDMESETFLLHEQEPATYKRWVLQADRETRINMGLPQHQP